MTLRPCYVTVVSSRGRLVKDMSTPTASSQTSECQNRMGVLMASDVTFIEMGKTLKSRFRAIVPCTLAELAGASRRGPRVAISGVFSESARQGEEL